MAAYPALALGLVALALVARVVLQLVARRRGRPLPVLPSLVTGVVLVALTLVFDNVMISAGLVAYDPELLAGLV
ncbi:lycopene cyclase domain-containing protein, partial [Schumannella luteola]